MKDQKELGLGDFRKIPNGIGSIEHRMDLMYQGVVTGEITLERWVELTSTTPARMFGLARQEGRHPARRRRRHRRLRPERPHVDRPREDPPHEHGLLRVGGLRDRRPRRHGALAAARSSSTAMSTSAPRATAASSSAASASTSSDSPDLSGAAHGLRSRPPDQPPGLAHGAPREARRAVRLQHRVDLRLAPAVAGAVRHLQQDPRRDAPHQGGPVRHEPGHPRLDRHGVDLRHAQRDVRQPHDLRHRPRRLGGARDERQADHAQGAARVDPRDPRARQLAPRRVQGLAAAVPVVAAARSSRCGSPPTGRWR